MGYAQIPSEDEELAHKIIGAAIEVHRVLGPEFLESVYERALEHELKSRGLHPQGWHPAHGPMILPTSNTVPRRT